MEDKKLFLEVIKKAGTRMCHTQEINADGLECVSYEGLTFLESVWLREGIKLSVRPALIEECERINDSVKIKTRTLSNREEKIVVEHLKTRNPCELEIEYDGMSPSRTTPQPLSRWSELDEPAFPENVVSQRKQVIEKVASEVKSTGINAGGLMDVGCGDGILLQKLTEKQPGLELWGVDLNRKCVLDARNRLKGKASILYGDARKLGNFTPKKDFNIVTATGVIDAQVATKQDGIKMLKQIHTILKNNGTLIIANYSPNTLKPAEIKKQGFRLQKKTIPENLYTGKEPKELIKAVKTF